MLDGNTKGLIDAIGARLGDPDLFHVSQSRVGGWPLFVLTFEGLVDNALVIEAVVSAEHHGASRNFQNATELFSFLYHYQILLQNICIVAMA